MAEVLAHLVRALNLEKRFSANTSKLEPGIAHPWHLKTNRRACQGWGPSFLVGALVLGRACFPGRPQAPTRGPPLAKPRLGTWLR